MYHHDIGKSTFDLWAEEQAKAAKLRKELTRLATAMSDLERAREAEQPQDEEQGETQ